MKIEMPPPPEVILKNFTLDVEHHRDYGFSSITVTCHLCDQAQLWRQDHRNLPVLRENFEYWAYNHYVSIHHFNYDLCDLFDYSGVGTE